MKKATTFEVVGRTVTLYRVEGRDRPLVVLNSYSDDGQAVVQELAAMGSPDCNLLVVSGLAWEDDLTPWPAPPLVPNEAPFTGGADAYLELLTGTILPAAGARLNGTPSWLGLAGYSLAGLFALYALHRTETFSRVASMSGSLWYPQFVDFCRGNALKRRPDKMYFSLGDREARTRNSLLATVQSTTERLVAQYRDHGLDVTWELNEGNHFKGNYILDLE